MVAAADVPSRLQVLLAKLKQDSKQGDDEQPGAENRQAKRRTGKFVPVEVSVMHNKEWRPIHGYVTDRSRLGLGIAMPGKPSKGEVLRVRPQENLDSVTSIEVEVVHVRLLDKDHVLVGCKFLKEQPWSTLLLFG